MAAKVANKREIRVRHHACFFSPFLSLHPAQADDAKLSRIKQPIELMVHSYVSVSARVNMLYHESYHRSYHIPPYHKSEIISCVLVCHDCLIIQDMVKSSRDQALQVDRSVDGEAIVAMGPNH